MSDEKPRSHRKHMHEFELLRVELEIEYTLGDQQLYRRTDHHQCKDCLKEMTSGSSEYGFTPPPWFKEVQGT